MKTVFLLLFIPVIACAQSIGDRIENAAERAGEAVGNAVDRTREGVQRAADRVRDELTEDDKPSPRAKPTPSPSPMPSLEDRITRDLGRPLTADEKAKILQAESETRELIEAARADLILRVNESTGLPLEAAEDAVRKAGP
ncbi:MAG: hypothetical protein SFU53_04705 [Terrimicrobiaceae bacterium]|nr:hypothetical protein [Terrimicrobiaceae bacterium]